MEIKAKLEEEKNIAFAKKMKDEGIDILYTNLDMKVHSKVLLIDFKDESKIAYMSTGNFNEKTAETYTDHALITSSISLCSELSILFNEIESGKISYSYKNLLISPLNLRDSFKEKILREINHARLGKEALLIFKMNGLQDKEMINLLYQASEAGVRVKLMVRGMCRLLSDRPYSKNITLVRVVDRFLEHGRIYYFHNDDNEEVYMGSADLMTKKLDKRVELVFPIVDNSLRKEMRDILDICLADNQKISSYYMLQHSKIPSLKGKKRSQDDLYSFLKAKY
jgi:polyphosphate kinase